MKLKTLTLREEHRSRVFENRMLRKIFGNNREEVVGGWRRLHGEDLYKLHATPHIISLMKSRRKLQRDTWHSWDR
jgi:hypothetical protein